MTSSFQGKIDAERLSGLIECAMDAVVAIDEEQRIVFFNRAAEAMFGCSAEEALGGSLDRFVPNELRAVHRRHVESFREKGETLRRVGTMRRVQGLRADQSRFPIEASICRLRSDDQDFLGAILRDVSASVEAEKSLERHQQRFAAIFHQRSELALLLTPDGRITDANPSATRWMRAPAAELIGQTLVENSWWTQDPAAGPNTRSAFERAKGGELSRFELRHQLEDGTTRSFQVSVVPILGSDGGCDFLLLEAVDVSEIRTAEAELRRTEKRAYEAEKLASIATLTAGIVHDIGAPMTAILGYAEMLKKSVQEEKDQRRAQIIIEQVQRVNELVQALMNMARSGDEKFEPFDLALVVRQSLDFYREMLHQRGIQVSLELQPGIWVQGERNRFQQALLNLIINAADAMVNGGNLHLTTKRHESGKALLCVMDSGIGMTPEAQHQIFEPFYTTKKRGQGTGLGLLATKSIIDQHHGTIQVDSRLGIGTTFLIEIPLAQPNEGEPA